MKMFFALLTLASVAIVCFAADLQGKKSVLRHVVAFKYKTSATADQIKAVEKAFSALPSKISEIKGFEWGLNNSPENRNKGCTHGYILTFTSEKDRDAYIIHPDHKIFGGLVGPLLDDVFVIDFLTKQ
ncbi:MAG: Dabb family protein [Verrucomicrobia bacterium]|nr:Dabb family protein [Verrucomicrobiota bacterium]MSU04141.1 Dabb family protein [Pedosphaera sp.]